MTTDHQPSPTSSLLRSLEVNDLETPDGSVLGGLIGGAVTMGLIVQRFHRFLRKPGSADPTGAGADCEHEYGHEYTTGNFRESK